MINEVAQHEQKNDFLSIIEKALSNPIFDADKLEKLINLQERILNKNAESAFNNDMVRLREELPIVVKNKRNSQTNSNYADLEAVQDVVYPLLNKYGFFDRYEDDYPADGLVGTTCEIVHRDGHSKRNRVQFSLDDKGIKGTVNKTLPHAIASSMTYGQRLSLCRALGVKIGLDDDGNLSGNKVISNDQGMQINSLIQSSGADKTGFLNYMGVDELEKIKASDFNKAITALNAKAKQAQK